MKRIFVAFILLLISTTAFSQQRVQLNNQFTGLELIGNMDIELIEDTVCQIDIVAYNIDIQIVKWRQKGGMLTISMPSGIMEKGGKVEMKIRVNGLVNMACDGCNVTSLEPLTSENLNIYSMSSQNKLNLNLNVSQLNMDIAGKSDVILQGFANFANFNVTMGAKLNAIKLEVNNCQVISTGASEAIVNVVENLNAKANTKGVIFYKGSPKAQFKAATWGQIKAIPIID